MLGKPDDELSLSFLDDQGVLTVVKDFYKKSQKPDGIQYNLVNYNCSTVVVNALQVGTQNVDRNRIKDIKSFGERVYDLFTSASPIIGTIAGVKHMTRSEVVMSSSFTPVKLFFSLAELRSFRTPRYVYQHVKGIKKCSN